MGLRNGQKVSNALETRRYYLQKLRGPHNDNVQQLKSGTFSTKVTFGGNVVHETDASCLGKLRVENLQNVVRLHDVWHLQATLCSKG